MYFFSDPHYSHKNFVRGVSDWKNKSKCRDFDTIDAMNDVIVNGINNTIPENSEAICLGDWNFGGVKKALEFRNKVNCKKIHLILGNHDNRHGSVINPKIDDCTNFYDLFESVSYYKEMFFNKTRICMMHYPIASWNEMSSGSIHLFGHCHQPPSERFFNGGKSMDVGMDGNNFKPYSILEILKIMEHRQTKQEGHH